MFEIGWEKILVVGVIALLVIGPKELPGVLRSVGQWVGKVRRMAAEFQSQFQEALREAELHDLKKTFDEATTAKDYGLNLDPLASVRKGLEGAVADLTAPPPPAPAPSAPSAPSATAAPPVPASVDPAAAGVGPAVPPPEILPQSDLSPFAGLGQPSASDLRDVAAPPPPAPVEAEDKQPS
jgi:sec-independent protein translocase protein TatB